MYELNLKITDTEDGPAYQNDFSRSRLSKVRSLQRDTQTGATEYITTWVVKINVIDLQ